MSGTKTCNKCFIEFNLNSDNFYVRKSSKDGYRNECKICILKDRKKYREENKEVIAKANLSWRKRNKEYIQEKGRLYYQENKKEILKKVKTYYRENTEKIMKTKKLYLKNNKEKVSLAKKNWARNNKDIVYKSGLKRRSRKHFVQFEGVARTRLLERDNWTCQSCNVEVHDRSTGDWNDEFKAHIDHVIPLSRGGDSTRENLQVLCRTCNLSKSNKAELEIDKQGQIKLSL